MDTSLKETILVFNIQEPQVKFALQMLLFPFQIKYKEIKKEDYLNPLGYLADNPEIPGTNLPYTGKELPAPMLVFAFLDDKKLDQVLAALRQSGLPSFPYKAVLTPTNQHWNPITCFEEIKRDHDAMNS